MKALIIKQPWIDYILSGNKIWEIRGCSTKKRGKIELIQSGSGLVVGTCELIDCKQITIGEFRRNVSKHNIPFTDKLPYEKTYAWILDKAKRYDIPRKYQHPRGAVIWVNLNDNMKQ